MSGLDRDARARLRTAIDALDDQVATAAVIRSRRSEIDRAASSAALDLTGAELLVARNGEPTWSVLPLRPADASALGALATRRALPPPDRGIDDLLDLLTDRLPPALDGARRLVGLRRLVLWGEARERSEADAEVVADAWQHSADTDQPGRLARAHAALPHDLDVAPADALDPRAGLADALHRALAAAELLPAAALAALPSAVAEIDDALREQGARRADALELGTRIRRRRADTVLAGLPVERLRDSTRDRLLLAPLHEAGIGTVLDVLRRGDDLAAVPGVGRATAMRILGAARTLHQTVYDESRIRFDVHAPTPETTALLLALARWRAVRIPDEAAADVARAVELAPLAHRLDPSIERLVVTPFAPATAADLLTDVRTVVGRASTIAAWRRAADALGDPWLDYRERAADVHGLLAELGLVTGDEAGTIGDLPDRIVAAVRAITLDTSLLRVASLRGYQSFGAKFAIAQRKVVIGDEMGLGKTIEALAVLTHLAAGGWTRALVVCPASVVTNWLREITAKSDLTAHRVHGPGRDAALATWTREGGVAVTTYGTLGAIDREIVHAGRLDCIVVDEAHAVKRPQAKRTRRTARLIEWAERAVLLTGSPLENDLDEFATLIEHVQPSLVGETDRLTAREFRRRVAPAYLRRNQEDVLDELPELVQVDEWLPFSTADRVAYETAVAEGTFMAMRQVAALTCDASMKLRRLREIVGEAEDNGRRVVVFSQFRAVLDAVAGTVPGRVFGPLTGSMDADRRQETVDAFSAASGGAVLVAQIVAGGVGLNIQAASVVVLTEPQLTPTSEWQAIARAHRMGQVESVRVHRLLSEEGVDPILRERLTAKRELFDDFARLSATADSAPEAHDVSEAELARAVVAAERDRLATADGS